jgi:predicted CoA-substrate-specific enzyme activase
LPEIFAGVDVGAGTSKAVIVSDDKVLAQHVRPTGNDVTRSAVEAMEGALGIAKLELQDISYVVSTGSGRRKVQFANDSMSEIICCAIGVKYTHPPTHTIMDIGCQDSKVIGLDDEGSVKQFTMNDRCAAGTGRFLEVLSHALEVELNEIGNLSLLGKDPCVISSTCTVFAESEVVSYRAQGRKIEDILAGLHQAIAKRVVIQGSSVGYRPDVVFTGGVARNIGVRKVFDEMLGLHIILPEEPQTITALGAAILAKQYYAKREREVSQGRDRAPTVLVP